MLFFRIPLRTLGAVHCAPLFGQLFDDCLKNLFMIDNRTSTN
jgi:hypothetical protein